MNTQGLNQFLSQRRQVLQAALASASASIGGIPLIAQAQSAWPSKPVRLMVPFGPGGQTDFAARVIDAKMSSLLGQPFPVENKAGAGGNIGAAEIQRAAPDGHNLLIGNSNITINPFAYKSTQMIDPLKLTPIGMILKSAMVLCVPSTIGVNDYAQFAAYAKAAKDGINYGSSSPGSFSHATMELLRDRMGKVKMTAVHYKGSAAAMQDLIPARVSAMFDAASVVAPFIKSGQLKAILSTGDARMAFLPDIPTAKERGLNDIMVVAFIGLYGPPGLPADLVAKANTALNTALKDPAVAKNITDRGDEVGGGSAAALGKLTADYVKMWEVICRENDIRAD